LIRGIPSRAKQDFLSHSTLLPRFIGMEQSTAQAGPRRRTFLSFRRRIAVAAILCLCAAAARADIIFATDETDGSILQIAPNGLFSTLASSVPLVAPTGLAFDAATNELVVGVAEQGSSPALYAIDQVGFSGSVTTLVSGLTAPISGLTFDNHGNLFASIEQQGVVDEISPAGTVTPYATGLGEVLSLQFDSHGDLFVNSDTGNETYEIAPGGSVSKFFHEAGDLEGLAIDNENNVYVSSGSEIYKVTSSGSSSVFASGTALNLYFGSSWQLFATEGDSLGMTTGGSIANYATTTGYLGAITDPSTSLPVPEPAGLGILALAVCFFRRLSRVLDRRGEICIY
jgi:hypothetical protein